MHSWLNPREWPSLHETYSSFALAVLKAIVLKKVGNIFISQYIFTSIRLKYFNMKKHFSDSLILRYFEEIGFSDQKPMILCAPSTSRWSRNRARNADQAARTCEKFADFMVRIIRLYYYQNMVDTFVWEIHEMRKWTCALFCEYAFRVLIGWSDKLRSRGSYSLKDSPPKYSCSLANWYSFC